MAAEYCIPAAAAYLSSSGFVLSASFLTGVLSGYNCSIPEVCSVDFADPASFLANKAGVAIGAAISLLPTSRGAKAVQVGTNILTKEATNVGASVLGKVVNKTTSIATNQTTQKTVHAAEKYVARKAPLCLDKLSKAGQVMDRGHRR